MEAKIRRDRNQARGACAEATPLAVARGICQRKDWLLETSTDSTVTCKRASWPCLGFGSIVGQVRKIFHNLSRKGGLDL